MATDAGVAVQRYVTAGCPKVSNFESFNTYLPRYAKVRTCQKLEHVKFKPVNVPYRFVLESI
jgi:hypothetical protein